MEKYNTKIMKGTEAIENGAKIIKKGGLVVFPTETVYGLGASAYDDKAISKIFITKNRPQDNPLIVHISHKDQINNIVRDITPTARLLIDAFMPGPITVVMKKSKNISHLVTAGLDSVGVRMPDKPVARQFIEKCQVPIVAPSANISTRVSPTSAMQAYDQLNGKVELIIDGGKCEVGIESTVVDATGEFAVILRPGVITEKMILEVTGVISVKQANADDKILPSPGTRYKHYAPTVPMIIATDVEKMTQVYEKETKKGKKVVILANSQVKEQIDNKNVIDLGATSQEVASNIYEALANAEKNFDYIICQYFSGSDIDSSIMNRIIKAASNNIL